MNVPRSIVGHCVCIFLLSPLAATAQTTEPRLDIGEPLTGLQTDTAETNIDLLPPMPAVLDESVSPAARDAYARGEKFLADGDTTAALREFSQAIKIDATFAEGFAAQAKVLALLGQNRSSAKALTTGLSIANDELTRANIYLARGELNMESNLFPKALDDFDHAFELQPENPVVSHLRGKAMRSLAVEEYAAASPNAGNLMQQALAAFDLALTLKPDFVEALSDRADIQSDLGRVDEAVKDLSDAMVLKPDDNAMRYRLAVLHLHRAGSSEARNETEQASKRAELQTGIDALTEALSIEAESPDEASPDEQEIRLARTLARMELAAETNAGAARRDLYEAALLDCQQVIDVNPELSAAHFQSGVVLRLLDRYREAVSAYTEAIRLAPESTEAHIRRGIAWYHLDEFDLALSDFRAVGVLPGDARPSFWTGVIHARRNEHLEAILAFSDALDENPRYILAFSNRARSLTHLGHWQRASDDLNAMIQINPDDTEAYYRRGIALQRLGRTEEAQHSFAQAGQRTGG